MENKHLSSPLIWLGIVGAAVLMGIGVGILGPWISLIILVVLIGLILGRNLQLLMAAILFSVALGQFGRIPPGTPSGAILLIDLLVCLLAGLWIWWVLLKRQKLVLSAAHLFWLGFIFLAGASLLFGPFDLSKRELLESGFYLVRFAAYTSLLWIIPVLFSNQEGREKLRRWLYWTGFAVMTLGFFQLSIIPDIGFFSRFGWDPHVGRLVSTFLDPNYLGGFFALFLALVVAPTVQESKKLPWFLIGLILLATILTFSRSGYLAVGLVALIFGLRFSWKVVLISLICIIPLALTVPRVRERVAGGFSIDKTAQDRITSWQNALLIGDQYWVAGVGYNTYERAQEVFGILVPGSTSRANAGSDSSLLNVLATTGVVGTALFLAAIGLCLRDCYRLVRSKPKSVGASMAFALLLATPALFIHAFFVNAFFYPFILVILATMMGIVYSELRDV